MADQEDQNEEVNSSEPAGQKSEADTEATPSENISAPAGDKVPETEEATEEHEVGKNNESSSDQNEKESESSTTSVAIDSLSSEKGRESTRTNYEVDPIEQSLYCDTDISVDPAAIEALTEGFVTRFLPALKKGRSSIDQIKSSQLVLIETVQQETSKFTECEAFKELEQTMLKAKQYHNKLLKLGREMNFLCEKSKKLKKRALKLQQQKQKEELTRAHDLEKEYEKERMLTAKVATSTD